ncbi:hypothetical protein FRC10_007150 [Ceratobasidium sp. 414]|nr:hypothetical protein FRC10_007150 [Ceratobasidium sp. 414]
MRVITLNYDPLICTCWSVPPEDCCPYCAAVCDAILADFEAGVGQWKTAGVPAKETVLGGKVHTAAVAEFFEEGQAPLWRPVAMRWGASSRIFRKTHVRVPSGSMLEP